MSHIVIDGVSIVDKSVLLFFSFPGNNEYYKGRGPVWMTDIRNGTFYIKFNDFLCSEIALEFYSELICNF